MAVFAKISTGDGTRGLLPGYRRWRLWCYIVDDDEEYARRHPSDKKHSIWYIKSVWLRAAGWLHGEGTSRHGSPTEREYVPLCVVRLMETLQDSDTDRIM